MERSVKISKIRLVVYLSVALVGVGLLTVGVLYCLASIAPAEYRPANLTAAERKLAVNEFGRHFLEEFNNVVQKTSPGEWTITQKQLNWYLGSMDEIAASRPGRHSSDVTKQLDAAGLAGPAAKLDDGVLTLMIRAKEYNKVISADIAFLSTEDGKLQVKLVAARLGNLAVPKSFVGDRLSDLKASLVKNEKRRQERRRKPVSGDDRRRETFGLSFEDVQKILTGLLSAIDEPPTRPEYVWPLNHKRFRIHRVEITKGRAVLHITPLGRAKRKG